jgi:hypothetical protein
MVVDVRGVSILIATAMAAASVYAAAPAAADANDDHFLELLNANGLGCGQGPFTCPIGDSDMIRMGRTICRQMRGANSKLSITQAIIRAKPGIQPAQAVTLVAVAEAAYCP